MDLLCLLRRGDFASADGPHRFVGDDNLVPSAIDGTCNSSNEMINDESMDCRVKRNEKEIRRAHL